jgi:hypothetical protein
VVLVIVVIVTVICIAMMVTLVALTVGKMVEQRVVSMGDSKVALMAVLLAVSKV